MIAARDQSRAEEIANSLSHGIGLAAALVGAPILIVQVMGRGDRALISGTAVFCATFILLYLASMLYHALPAGRAKRVFRVLDHASIYLLIAGTYTPFALGILRGTWGWVLFGTIWTLATIGLVFKAMGKTAHPVISTGFYLLMGWTVVIAAAPMIAKVPTSGLLLLLVGGLSYTAGVAFFAFDSRLRYGHLIWHLFVLGGTVCHYFAVLWYA